MLMSQAEKTAELAKQEQFLARTEEQCALAQTQYQEAALTFSRNSTGYRNADHNYKEARSNVGQVKISIRDLKDDLTHEDLAQCKEAEPEKFARWQLLHALAERPRSLNTCIEKNITEMGATATVLHHDSHSRKITTEKTEKISSLNECNDETTFMSLWVKDAIRSAELLHSELHTLQEAKIISSSEAKDISKSVFKTQLETMCTNLKSGCSTEVYHAKLNTLQTKLHEQPKTENNKSFLSEADSKFSKQKTACWLHEKGNSISKFLHLSKDHTEKKGESPKITQRH